MDKAKKILNLIHWTVLTLLTLVAVALVLSNFNTPFKYRVFSVTSGSMEPEIHTGSLVVVHPESKYTVGDVITFRGRRNANETVTHRITDITGDLDLGSEQYTTKGDANEDPDLVAAAKSQIIGKVLFSIPFVGYPLAFAKTQLGFIILVIIPATIIVYSELLSVKNELVEMYTKRKVISDKVETKKKAKDKAGTKTNEQ